MLILKIKKLGLKKTFLKSKIQRKQFYNKSATASYSLCIVSFQEITLERSKQSISNCLPLLHLLLHPHIEKWKIQ